METSELTDQLLTIAKTLFSPFANSLKNEVKEKLMSLYLKFKSAISENSELPDLLKDVEAYADDNKKLDEMKPTLKDLLDQDRTSKESAIELIQEAIKVSGIGGSKFEVHGSVEKLYQIGNIEGPATFN